MTIDPPIARTLLAVIEQDLAAVRRLDGKVEALAEALEDENMRNSAAYHLHNIYNALENSFRQVSRSFENHITQPERWHRELLEKMFLDLTPIRPALLSPGSRSLLLDLTGFRHLFRHAYEFELDTDKLAGLLDRWKKGRANVLADLERFARLLGSHASPDEGA